MRLQIVLPDVGGGGAERHFVILTQELTKLGQEVEMVLLRAEGVLSNDIPPHVQVHVLGRHRNGHRHGLSAPARHAARHKWIRVAGHCGGGTIGRLRRLWRERPPDVVLSTLWEADLVAGFAIRGAASVRSKWVVVAEFDFEQHVARKPVGALLMHMARKLYRRADAFIAPSSQMARQVSSLISAPDVPVWTIPNAIPVEAIRTLSRELPEGRDRTLRSARQDTPLLVSVGRLDRQKGFDVLLQALSLVHKRFPTTCLLILGEGPARLALEHMTHKLGLDAFVHWLGFVPNPFPWMARANVVLVPSRWEPFGNVVAEAMTLGVPVVATRSGGPEDMIDHGSDGLLVPVGDAEALSDAVLEVLSDDTRRRHIGERAREKAKAFTAPIVARTYLEHLDGLLSRTT